MADLELLLDVAVINRGEGLQRRAEAGGSWKGLDRGGHGQVSMAATPSGHSGERRFQITGQDQP